MPRKSRKKALPDTPAATEPTPVAAVLEQSPAMQAILVAQDAKSRIEPEQPMPEPEAPQAEPQPLSHVERLARQSTGLKPVPEGFRNVDAYPDAGIRVNRSLDRSVLAIQFAEDRRASRDGLNTEVDTLQIEGFRYEPLRRQWEREDRGQPGANAIAAKRLGAVLAAKRTGREL